MAVGALLSLALSSANRFLKRLVTRLASKRSRASTYKRQDFTKEADGDSEEDSDADGEDCKMVLCVRQGTIPGIRRGGIASHFSFLYVSPSSYP